MADIAYVPLVTGAFVYLAIFGFIEGFYNTHRPDSALGHQSPIEFDRGYQPSP